MNHFIVKNPVMSRAAARRLEKANKLTVFRVPVETADGGLHGFLSARSSAYFKKEIDKAPADAVLLIDLHETELQAFNKALSESNRARATVATSKHIDELRDKAGFARVIVFGEACKLPSGRERLRAYYTADELLDAAGASAYDHRALWPDACAKREHARQARKVATSGGLAAAVNTDGAILSALSAYKVKHPGHTMTTAVTNIVDKGTLQYANYDKLLARLSSMGKRMNPPKRPTQIYADL